MISKRDLYAHGEPLGNGATRRKIGGGLVCGFGGDSSSSTENTTNNFDNRVAVSSGLGLSSSNGNTINVTDGGIVTRALDFGDRTVNRAFNTVDFSTAAVQNTVDRTLAANSATTTSAIGSVNAGNAAALAFADSQAGRALELADSTYKQGFQTLLTIGAGLFDQGAALIDKTQTTVAGAYADAQNTAKGTIDNRTLIVLAVAAAGTLAAIFYLKRK